jgi:RNA polymerase sigma factor (sigma-70 family)
METNCHEIRLPVTIAPHEFDYEAALGACSRGDEQALRSIYNQESQRMLGIAMRIVRQRQLAEDVLHDAFLSIWSKARSFDSTRGSARGWIYSIVRHQALDVVRSGAREVSVSEEALERSSPRHRCTARHRWRTRSSCV